MVKIVAGGCQLIMRLKSYAIQRLFLLPALGMAVAFGSGNAQCAGISTSGNTTAANRTAQKKPISDSPQPQPSAPIPFDPIAREALISVFAGDRERLAQSYHQAVAREQQYRTAGLPSSEAILYLYNCTIPDREQFLQAQEAAAAQTSNNELKTRILLSLLTDEVYELERVEGQNRFNKFTRIFNRASTSLSRLALLQPQDAVQLLWDGIYSIRRGRESTDRERKMLYLSRAFLEKYPNAPEAAETAALAQSLQQKLNKDRARLGKLSGENAFKHGNFALAEYHLEKSAILDSSNSETSQLLVRARTARTRQYDADSICLTVSNYEHQLPAAEKALLQEAARTLVSGDLTALADIRQRSGVLWDSVDYGQASLAESRQNHATALQKMNAVAKSAPNQPGGKAAARELKNPSYNLDEQFDKAVADLSARRRKFIVTGDRSREDATYALGNAAIQNAGQSATGIPLLVGADAAVRAVVEQFRTQLEIGGVVDAGAKYLRKYPDAPNANTIRQKIGSLSEKSGDYTRAMSYLDETGSLTPDGLLKLREKQAGQTYDKILTETNMVDRKKRLVELKAKYADVARVQKNTERELAKLPPNVAIDSIALPSKALRSDPSVLTALGLPAIYADGAKSNGELAAEGICINPSNRTLDYRLTGENTWRTGGLAPGNADALLAHARQLLASFTAGTQGQDRVKKQKLPFAIEGGAGGSGVDVAPKLVPAAADPGDKDRFKW